MAPESTLIQMKLPPQAAQSARAEWPSFRKT
jgi:hypothetical protein